MAYVCWDCDYQAGEDELDGGYDPDGGFTQLPNNCPKCGGSMSWEDVDE